MLFLSYLKIRLDKKDLVKYKNILIYNLAPLAPAAFAAISINISYLF